MLRRPPESPRTATFFPYPPLFRSGRRLLELVQRHDVVRSSPAYENLLARKGTCRQSIVLDGKAAANHDKARIGFWRLDQQIGRHGGAVAEATQIGRAHV